MSNELQPPASPVVAQQGQGSASTSAGQQKPPEQTAEQGKDGGGLNQNQAQAGTGTQGDGVGAVKESPEELRAQLDAVRRELAANLQKKQSIDRTLASHESSIYAFETSYLSIDLSAAAGTGANATFGNIVRGYDAYLKTGSTSTSTHSAADRKKAARNQQQLVGLPGMQPVMEEERIFSRSSGTYMRSLELRERDAGVVTASEEDEDENGGSSAHKRPRRK